MIGIAAAVYLIVLVVIVAAVWLIVRKRERSRAGVVPAGLAPVLAAARRRALISVLFAVVVFIVGAILSTAMPGLLGLPLVVSPLVAGACGMLLYAATPPRSVVVGEDQVRTAPLTRRSALSVGSRRSALALVEVSVLFVVVIVFCGVVADPDDSGRSRAISFSAVNLESTATPFPGWYYGVPALIGLGLLVVATVIALYRIGRTAAFPDPEDAELDLHWRQVSGSVIVKLAIGGILLTLGGTAMMAGLSMSNATIDDVTPVIWDVLGATLSCIGILCIVLSIVSVTLSALTAMTVADGADRPSPAHTVRSA
jgi:hypothetical protein